MSLPTDEILPEEPNGELVHWMEPGSHRFGLGGVSTAAATAFAAGVLATVGAYALYRWLWGRGPLH